MNMMVDLSRFGRGGRAAMRSGSETTYEKWLRPPHAARKIAHGEQFCTMSSGMLS